MQTQAGCRCNGGECAADEAQCTGRDIPVSTPQGDSRAEMLADISELGDDLQDASVPTNPISVTSAALTPLVFDILPRSSAMPATDTDSQEAVEDFEITPSDINACYAMGGFDNKSSGKSFGSNSPDHGDCSIHEVDPGLVHGADIADNSMWDGNGCSNDGPEQMRCQGHAEVRRCGIAVPVYERISVSKIDVYMHLPVDS